jgi:ATP-dependent protease HslVU (ClpYQ) peptidase subunit
MTCIIGLELGNGKTLMGADRQYTTGWLIKEHSKEYSKIFELGLFMVGFSGHVKTHQIIEHFTKVGNEKTKNNIEYIIKNLILPIKTALREHGDLKKENEIENMESGYFLVSYAGKIYNVGYDFAISRSIYDFNAVGSGENLANGAMMALKNLPPKKRIKKSLKIVSEFDAYVGGSLEIKCHAG